MYVDSQLMSARSPGAMLEHDRRPRPKGPSCARSSSPSSSASTASSKPPGGGNHEHAGWTFEDVEFDPAAYEIKGREQQDAAALLLGRVDRYTLLTFPVILGGGKRLFADDGIKTRLTLVESQQFANGINLAVFDVAR